MGAKTAKQFKPQMSGLMSGVRDIGDGVDFAKDNSGLYLGTKIIICCMKINYVNE